MLITLFPVALLLGLILSSIFVWAFLLLVGLHWAKAPEITFRRVFLTTAGISCLAGILWIVWFAISVYAPSFATGFSTLRVAIFFYLSCRVIAYFNQLSFKRAFKAWIPTIFTSILPLAMLQFVIRPYLFDTYSLPSNAMAPTILGPHHQGVCPECGATSYYAAQDQTRNFLPQLMICEHFHTAKVTDTDSETLPEDEILVAKFRKPGRWELAVFQHPHAPSILQTKRLVGLPGETITIQDGAIYADGKQLTLPASLQELEYLTEMEDGPGQPLWGSPERPAKLGDDEYFVLGDFSARTADSRTWKEGAPNRASYAVPESHLKGVVTHIVRPFHRMRVLD